MDVNGHQLTCPHCGGESFTQGKAQLNTKVMTFLELDFLNKQAVTYICDRCGRIEWFASDSRDPEFIRWLDEHPEYLKRDETDQIALYRDYQKKCAESSSAD